MIPFRAQLRSAYLSTAGRLKSPSSSIHILNGHVIGMKAGDNRQKFRNLLRELKRTCDFVRIEDACTMIAQGTAVQRPALAFTFDDGYEECFTDIAPVLEEFGVNAAFFINPHFTMGDQRYITDFLAVKVPEMPKRQPMSAAMVAALARRGFVIGAHTLDHERLVSTNAEFLQTQVVDCRAAVERLSGTQCDYFAWTYGQYSDISDEALALAKETYRWIFSSDKYANYTCDAVLNRRHFECDWPASHVRYFLAPARQFV